MRNPVSRIPWSREKIAKSRSRTNESSREKCEINSVPAETSPAQILNSRSRKRNPAIIKYQVWLYYIPGSSGFRTQIRHGGEPTMSTFNNRILSNITVCRSTRIRQMTCVNRLVLRDDWNPINSQSESSCLY